ncbi:methyl-accepting chemotaxis sensory transducer with Cache sensor [Mobilisporobacter senegalensis]|uniref:Methyl-accepting chemotaxis sensory transducer with Cache sensor n=1 Tax=Mobilisporobacter senegalensis TaxID=1329262 RepID=A0A3N1XB29_9FIRM|nr:methyl-accepting chemotaxis protein [Mobilisporobacter senegalensis]ROR23970.1 methyl-accepting chemotaxis sensory transducer with Cache sensor [Mobilisporobacter senegalensis]
MIFKKISTKMLVILLSVIILSMITLSFVSYWSSRAIIQNQISENMDSELNAQINSIQLKLQKIDTMASQIAKSVENTYSTTKLDQYEKMLESMIFDSDLVLGSGIWFEPYVYDSNEKYVGPYVYKEGDKAVTTYDYSNAEYDYFSYDWYKNAMTDSREPVFSTLYYDETLKATMSSCTAPMYDANDKFIGVITIDTEITLIQDLINNIKVGDKGRATLLTKDGFYITNEDSAKVLAEKITDSGNKSIAALGSEILNNDKGEGHFTEGNQEYEVYYSSVEDLGWKVLIQIPKEEVDRPVNNLFVRLMIISGIALLLSAAVIILLVRNLTKGINKANQFALNLSNGDFTTAEINIKSKDELGQLGNSLNKMLEENRTVIKSISADSKKIIQSGEELTETSEQLTTNFAKIKTAINGINESMMSSSATTEELNASVEEVNSSINILSQETNKSYEMALGIKERAEEVEKISEISFKEATNLAASNEVLLRKSMEDAKIVESIDTMAEVISQIAEQVNLLSLNASIEAARAGEHGKGFAVVAKEIGSLAFQTTSAIQEIKQTNTKVLEAFQNITNNSNQLLFFIKDRVTPDYKNFVRVANQYGQDAKDIQSTVSKIADMTNSIDKIIGEVSGAIQDIAISSQNTALNSGEILNNVDVVYGLANNIAQLIDKEKEISDDLDGMVKKFNI